MNRAVLLLCVVAGGLQSFADTSPLARLGSLGRNDLVATNVPPSLTPEQLDVVTNGPYVPQSGGTFHGDVYIGPPPGLAEGTYRFVVGNGPQTIELRAGPYLTGVYVNGARLPFMYDVETAIATNVWSKADEFSGWEFSGSAVQYYRNLRCVEYVNRPGGRVEYEYALYGEYAWDEPGYEVYIGMGARPFTNRVDSLTPFYSDGVPVDIVASRRRVMRMGDPSIASVARGELADWRANAYSIAIGSNAVASANRGIAIGFPNAAGIVTEAGGTAVAIGVGAKSTGGSSVAIGPSSQALGANSVQLGSGVNNESATLKFRSWKLVGSDGRIPVERLPAGGADVQADMLDGVYYRRLIYDGSVYYVAVTNLPPLPQEQQTDDPEEVEP